MIELSIIIPVYNVEKYILPCIESILCQGLDEERFELIIVNDGTKDNSMEIIADVISHHNNITVINQENQGLSIARNNGIEQAQGKYILMPDPDDLLIKYSLKPLLKKAVESQADLVVADFLTMTDEEIKSTQSIPQKNFIIKEESGEQLFLEDLSPYACFVWRTLYRKEFLTNNHLRFYPGIRFQDIPFTHECYLKANKCLRVSWLLNIYRKWPGASTGSFNKEKAWDFCIAIAKTWELNKLELSPAIRNKLQNDLWTHFWVMTRQTCQEIHKDSERISVIDCLKKEAPTLSFQNGAKQECVTFLYKYMPHTFIRLRYLYYILIEDRFHSFNHH